MNMANELEKEMSYFKKLQNELQAKNPAGGFAVIKNDKLLGIWLNRIDAIKQGIEAFGNVSFLVKDINYNPNHIASYSRPLKYTHGVSHSS